MEYTTTPLNTLRPLVWDDLTLDRAIRGEVKVWNEGGSAPYKLNAVQMRAFESAKQQGWVVCRGVSAYPLLNAWFTWCELRQRPYVKIVQSVKYAAVQMDLIAVPYRLSPELKAQTRKEIEGLLGPLHPRRCITQQCLVHVQRVSLECAPAIAEILVRIGLEAKSQADGINQLENKAAPASSTASRIAVPADGDNTNITREGF